MDIATPDGGRRRRRFRAALALLLGLATVGLVAGLELAASLFVDLPRTLTVPDPQLNHTWPPGGRRVHAEWAGRSSEFPTPYTHVYNRQGWLETYDVDPTKPAGTYRVFYVGDSFTEGCVPMDESVASRVEAYLDERLRRATGRPVEVINTGTSSYSPILYFILIRRVLLAYDPDAIVVNVDMTDDYDDWKYEETMVVDDAGDPMAAPPRGLYESAYIDTAEGAVRASPLTRLQLFLIQRSHLYNLLLRHDAAPPSAEGSGDAFAYRRFAWCSHDWDEMTRRRVAFTEDMLRRIARLCGERDIRLLLTAVPHYRQFALGQDGRTQWSKRPHDVVRGVAEEAGVAYLDSWEALRPAVTGTEQARYYYPGDMHLNPRGNALWAEAHIRAWLDPENRLLPDEAYEPAAGGR